jgi:methionyl-tRNA synthetase
LSRPTFLLSAGLPLPDTIFVHGFLTVNGRKISKTEGNLVDPFEVVQRYDSDAVRYYLLRAVQPFEDGDFSTERLNHLNPKLTEWLSSLHAIGYWIQPFLPDTAASILRNLSAETVVSVPPLFPRIR